jgi:hypothetical protein
MPAERPKGHPSALWGFVKAAMRLGVTPELLWDRLNDFQREHIARVAKQKLWSGA